MKRYGNLWFSRIATYENVRLAIKIVLHLSEDKNGNFYISEKRESTLNKEELYIFEHLEEVTQCILEELKNRKYQFGNVKHFIRHETRKDRSINHLNKHGAILLQCVLNVCQPLFIKKYIPFTYSSIKGRGLTTCILRLKKIFQYHPNYYFIQLDAHHCYENVSHKIMHDILCKNFKDKYVIEFFDKMMETLQKGLAIGYSPNHYLVNLMFSGMDHRMLEREGFIYYNRYMDDVIIPCETKDECIRALRIIEEEFEKIGMVIKPNVRIAPLTYGADFCGYVFYPTHVLLRKSIKLRMIKRDKALRKLHVSDEVYKRKMASYYGWCKWGNCRNLTKKVFVDKLYLFEKQQPHSVAA